MSLDSARAFFEDANNGKIVLDLAKFSAASPADRLTYVHSLGYSFTQEEISAVLKENDHSMTMEEAEAIVGGGHGAAYGEAAGGGAAIGIACGLCLFA